MTRTGGLWGSARSRRGVEGLKITPQESASRERAWGGVMCILKTLQTADVEELSIFGRHLSPNRLPFKQGQLQGSLNSAALPLPS